MIQVLLIGNGFDIAHGLPTKFTDFSKHILEEVLIPDLIKCVRDDDYSSNFFNEGLKSILHEDSFPISRPNNSLSKMIDLIVKNENNETQYKRFKHVLIDNKSIFLDYLENKLLLTLYKEESEYWFDIETTFYNQLIKIKDDTSTTKYGVSRKDKINRLNLEFSTIKHQLKEYLKKLKTKNEGPVKSFIQNFMHKAKVNGNSVVVIDFNYTSTILKIYDQNRHPFQHFPIHGTLDSEIVFGWGNDKDESYQEIKLLEDEFQKNFKTRQYSITPYY
jgi:hypothetical protein